MGAVGSAAPWFLTGWTNEVEVEFLRGSQFTLKTDHSLRPRNVHLCKRKLDS